MPKILLHVCCAPCATHPVEVLAGEGELIGYFANPNIQPIEEYTKRFKEAVRFFDLSKIPLIEASYAPDDWNNAVQGLENEPEGGRRCEACFRLRLYLAANEAKKLGCDSFTTTLTVSNHKNSSLILRIGEEAGENLGVPFRKSDFKKRGGYDRSLELSKKLGLYRQNYCGCIYSLRDRRNDDNDNAPLQEK